MDFPQCRIRHIHGVISTDDIIPGRYKHMYTDTAKLAQHVFENRFPGLAETFRPGDVIVCEDTFGIGSSREQAVSSLIAAGIKAVVAPHFGRIFFRNSWNLGLPAIEADATRFSEGAVVHISMENGRIEGATALVSFTPPPRQVIDMVLAGGLLPQLARRISVTAQAAGRQ